MEVRAESEERVIRAEKGALGGKGSEHQGLFGSGGKQGKGKGFKGSGNTVERMGGTAEAEREDTSEHVGIATRLGTNPQNVG